MPTIINIGMRPGNRFISDSFVPPASEPLHNLIAKPETCDGMDNVEHDEYRARDDDWNQQQ